MQSPSAACKEDVVAPSHDEAITLGYIRSLPEDQANALYVIMAPADTISSGSTLLGVVSAKALLPEAHVNAPMLLQSALNHEAKELSLESNIQAKSLPCEACSKQDLLAHKANKEQGLSQEPHGTQAHITEAEAFIPSVADVSISN